MTVGIPPIAADEQLINGAYLLGVAADQNNTTQYNISATSATSNGAATQLQPGFALMEIDSSAATSAGFALPTAVGGTNISIYNNTSHTVMPWPAIANNPVTSAQDTINNTSSGTVLSAHTGGTFFCVVTSGGWCQK